MTEGIPPLEPALPAPEAASPLAAEQASGIVARISEKINDLTNLPYDLLARWKTREPGSAQALLDHAGPLGKLVSPVVEKVKELVEQIGHENVVGIYRIGAAAVKGVLLLKGVAISSGSGAENLSLTQQDADDQFMAKATGAAKATLDLNTPIAKGAANLEAQSAAGTTDPAVDDYEVDLPEWNGKTGEGSIWFALNDKEKGIASILGYDDLTEKQKRQLTNYVLKENNLSWADAKKIDKFMMPSHDELEAKLDEIGAKYNPDADKRDTLLGGGLGGENPNLPPDELPGKDEKPPHVPPVPTPPPTPPPTPSPHPSVQTSSPPPSVAPQSPSAPPPFIPPPPGTEVNDFKDKVVEEVVAAWEKGSAAIKEDSPLRRRSLAVAGLGLAAFAGWAYHISDRGRRRTSEDMKRLGLQPTKGKNGATVWQADPAERDRVEAALLETRIRTMQRQRALIEGDEFENGMDLAEAKERVRLLEEIQQAAAETNEEILYPLNSLTNAQLANVLGDIRRGSSATPNNARPTGNENLANDEQIADILRGLIRDEALRQRLPRMPNVNEMTLVQLRAQLRSLQALRNANPDFRDPDL